MMKILKNFKSWVLELLTRHLMLILLLTLLIVSAVVVTFPRSFVVIPAGFQGVLYRPFSQGVDDKIVLGEGLNVILPWNTIFQYDSRIQIRKLEMEVLTADQLKSKVALTFQFEVNRATLPLLHRYLGPSYIDTVVIPEVTNIAREMFGKLSSASAFTLEINKIVRDIALNSDNVIISKLSPPGVDSVRLVRISAVQLDSISYPQLMQDAIQDKLVQQQVAASYEYRLQAARLEVERKVIEAGGIRQFQDIVNAGMTDNYLRYKGIEATQKLAESPNSKIVIFGNSPGGLPLILGSDTGTSSGSTASISSGSPPGMPANADQLLERESEGSRQGLNLNK